MKIQKKRKLPSEKSIRTENKSTTFIASMKVSYIRSRGDLNLEHFVVARMAFLLMNINWAANAFSFIFKASWRHLIIKKEKLLGGIIILVKVENQLGPGNTNVALFQFKFQFQNFKLKLSIFKTDIDNSLELRTDS